MKEYYNKDYSGSVLLLLTIILLSSLIFYFRTVDIELKIANDGWGPQDYVNQKLYPQNFGNDFPNGIMQYDYSLPIRIYFYLAKYFSLYPTTTMYPFMFVQILLFVLSVAYVTHVLFGNRLVTFLATMIVPFCNLAGLNLSRFGSGYGSLLSLPLFYGYANAFRFFAFGFFLRNKYIPCFIFLALSFYCHVNMGFFALAFIGAYMLYKPHLIRERSLIGGIFIFFVLVAPHILSIISNASIFSGGIPVDYWVKSTKIFSFHWYPIVMKSFTSSAHKEFFPFILLCVFFLIALRYHDIREEKCLIVIAGCIICLILSALGVFFSEVFPAPSVIRISPQRSTGLITFFGTLYIIYYLCKKIEKENFLINIFSVYSLFLLAMSRTGIAIVPLLILVYFDISDGYLGFWRINGALKRRLKVILCSCVFVTCSIVFVDILAHYVGGESSIWNVNNFVYTKLWTPLQFLDPFRRYDFLVRGGGFKVYHLFSYVLIGSCFIAVFLRFAGKMKHAWNMKIYSHLVVIACVVMVGYIEREVYLRWETKFGKEYSDYFCAQIWAKNNTAIDALFMTDPSHYYGWRDFSVRSSFGNLHEWGYTGIAYHSNKEVYEEGIKRMKEFGIDIDKISDEDLKNSKYRVYLQQLSKKLHKDFYDMTPADLIYLARKYKIDFVVMNRKYHRTIFHNLKIAYENDNFIVYRLLNRII